MRVERDGVAHKLRVVRSTAQTAVMITDERDGVARVLNIGGKYALVHDPPGEHAQGWAEYSAYGELAALCMRMRDETMRSFVPSDEHRFWWSEALACVTEYMNDPERVNHVLRWGE